ncbi:MAG: HlyD family efflux transporter periplasmic adaptor subunit [Betaproteobacteria bacterium]|nr:HlyD family efflux transporter periplasmic adaptor subunit [Betaproteobacteria bacterium]
MNFFLKFLFKTKPKPAVTANAPDPVLMARVMAHRQQNAREALRDQYNDIYLFKLQPPQAWARHSLWATAIVIVAFIVWASVFTLDEVTSGLGKVITTSREQVVQSMESGVVAEIMVKEGQHVEQGQALMRINDVKIGSNMQETKARINALRAASVRLKAESLGKTKLSAADFTGITADLIQSEIDTFQARRKALEGNLASQLQNLKISQEELQLTEPLAAKGLVSDIDVLRIKRSLAETRGRINEINDKFKADASSELSRIEGDMGSQTATLAGRTDAYKRTIVYSPKKGIVKNIRVNTLGAVVQSGQDILEIVPVEETLLIETRIRPTDIAFLHPGLPATVKLTAYDSGIYGWLEAEVLQISPDTLRDEVKRDETYYRALVKTSTTALKSPNGEMLPIIPGMQAQVDIKTGKKTVLSYLFKPVLKIREAFRER